MGSQVEPEGDLSEVNGASGGFPVTRLCLFLLLVVSSEMPGWRLSYRYKSTDDADATQGSCLWQRDRTGSWGGRQTERDVKILEQDALKVVQEHLR